MSRIKQHFETMKAAGRKALIPFVTAGDPNPGVTVGLMHKLVEAGADIIELGVPFSDPMADGPVIQRASERALEHHVSLRNVLDMVRSFRTSDNKTPVVLMGYLNPVEVMGYQQFAQAAAEAGVDGVLTVDMPPEEAAELVTALQEQEIDPIFLLAPTTDEARVDRICGMASGFVYYVSVKGITGAGHLDIESVAEKVSTIRGHTELPVGVGFGIKDGKSAAAVAETADAVVVGSALVRRIEEKQGEPVAIPDYVAELVTEIRQAIDSI